MKDEVTQVIVEASQEGGCEGVSDQCNPDGSSGEDRDSMRGEESSSAPQDIYIGEKLKSFKDIFYMDLQGAAKEAFCRFVKFVRNEDRT